MARLSKEAKGIRRACCKTHFSFATQMADRFSTDRKMEDRKI
jgi:hypothetical protein